MTKPNYKIPPLGFAAMAKITIEHLKPPNAYKTFMEREHPCSNCKSKMSDTPMTQVAIDSEGPVYLCYKCLKKFKVYAASRAGEYFEVLAEMMERPK